jgi:hypothetical protein
MSGSYSRDVEIVFADEELEAVRAILEEEGAEQVSEVEESDLLPAVAIVIAASIALIALCNIVIKLSRLWACGVVVDARGTIIHTEKNCDLPRGDVLVFSQDGTKHTLHEPKEADLRSVIEAAVGGA